MALVRGHFARDGEGPSAQAWRSIDAAPSTTFTLFEPAIAAPAGRAGELALAALNIRHDAGAAQVWIEQRTTRARRSRRAQLGRSQGKIDDVRHLADLDRAIALEPTSYDARRLRAHRRLAEGNAAGALGIVDAALVTRRPSDPALHGVRGSALVRLGRYAEARVDLLVVEQSEYWFWAQSFWYLAGVAALQAGDLADGTARLEKYVEFEPGLVLAWQALEQAYTAQGREADAVRARHNQAMNLYLLALGSERAGDKPRALERLHRALAIVPDHPQAKEALAARRLARFTPRGAAAHTAPVNDTSDSAGTEAPVQRADVRGRRDRHRSDPCRSSTRTWCWCRSATSRSPSRRAPTRWSIPRQLALRPHEHAARPAAAPHPARRAAARSRRRCSRRAVAHARRRAPGSATFALSFFPAIYEIPHSGSARADPRLPRADQHSAGGPSS